MFWIRIRRDKKLKIFTPTPSPLTDTTVRAANNVIITPTTKAVGMMAKVRRFNR